MSATAIVDYIIIIFELLLQPRSYFLYGKHLHIRHSFFINYFDVRNCKGYAITLASTKSQYVLIDSYRCLIFFSFIITIVVCRTNVTIATTASRQVPNPIPKAVMPRPQQVRGQVGVAQWPCPGPGAIAD